MARCVDMKIHLKTPSVIGAGVTMKEHVSGICRTISLLCNNQNK